MRNKELFENCIPGKEETLKRALNEKRKLEYDLAKVEFKIKLMTKTLDNLYYDDLPISDNYIYTLITCTSCKNLLEFWIAGSTGIQVMLSENGVHEELSKVMESVKKVFKMIDTYNGIENLRL